MLNVIFLIVFSCVALALAGAIFFFCRREELLARCEKLPRAKNAGIVLGALVIFWCIPNLRPVLDPDSFLQGLLIPLAVVSIILCAFFLDYLFARAFGGLLILLAHFFLKESFAFHVHPLSAILAGLLLLLGTAGIVISAKPYYFRDWIRFLFRKPAVRFVSSGFLGALALFGFAVAIAAFIRGV